MVIRGIIIDNASTIEVLRNGEVVKIPVDVKWVDILSRYENKSNFLFSARIPFKISMVTKNSPAEKGGLKTDDVVLGFNDLRHLILMISQKLLNLLPIRLFPFVF